MGITVEQYRSRIGKHDNFLKSKDALSHFKDRFWNIMLMMFYMNVFYLQKKTSCWTIQNIEWSSVLVYPIHVLQCLHATVDTISIIRKPQRFWYWKSHNTIMNFPVHWTLLSFSFLSVSYSWNLLWWHSGCISLRLSGSWSVIQDHLHSSSKDEPVAREDSSVSLMHQWSWITDPDPDNPKEMHLSLSIELSVK